MLIATEEAIVAAVVLALLLAGLILAWLATR